MQRIRSLCFALTFLTVSIGLPAFATDTPGECKWLEKQVGVEFVNGDFIWRNADDPSTAPTQQLGNNVNYRFIVTNCAVGAPDEKELFCTDVMIDDATLDIWGHVHDLAPGESVIVTSLDEGFENLRQPGFCKEPGLYRNHATMNCNVGGDALEFADDAYVRCGDEEEPPSCDVAIDKTCRVETPPTPAFDGSCKGKIQEFTLVWNGTGPVQLSGVAPLTTSVASANPGDEVTFFGNNSGDNDVFVNVSGAANGQSVFHLSCSDDDMDADTDSNDEQNQVSPAGQDCGKTQGNSKGKSGFVNQWLLEGLVDAEGKVLDCTPSSPTGGFADSCSFEAPGPVSCETRDKPQSLTLRYDGIGPVSDCTDNDASRANQKPPVCSGNLPAGATVSVSLADGSASPTTVAPGETFTITGYGSNTLVQLTGGGGSETDTFHTSCSAPLAVGDVFGNLTLVGFDGESAAANVTYRYVVTSLTGAFANASVVDDVLGAIGDTGPVPAGGTAVLTATTSIDSTTTNTATVSAVGAAGGLCAAQDSVTVSVVAPTCKVSASLKEIKEDEIKFYLTNTSKIVATLEELQFSFPGALGAIKKVELDGDIFKKEDSSTYPNGVPSGATIGSGDWTKSDVSKRQLDPGEKRELKFRFEQKYKTAVPADLSGSVVFGEGCSVTLP